MDERLTKLLRRQAVVAVREAIKSGELPALDGSIKCTDCWHPATDYDHRDYTSPLTVDPVCRGCNVRRGQGAPLLPSAREKKLAIRKKGNLPGLTRRPKTQPREFSKIVYDLIGCGYTQTSLAKLVGTCQTNISELLRGREPKYYLGKRLVELHEKKTNE